MTDYTPQCSIEVTLETGTAIISGTEDFIERNKDELFNFLMENYTSKKGAFTKLIDSNEIDISDTKPDNQNNTKIPIELEKYTSIFQIDAENNIILLKDTLGKNKSEKAREIAKLVLYIKTKIEKKPACIYGSELITLCKRHGCYDAANYSKAFDNQDDFIKGGKEKSQNWTLELKLSGEQAAKKLLEDILNADN